MVGTVKYPAGHWVLRSADVLIAAKNVCFLIINLYLM